MAKKKNKRRVKSETRKRIAENMKGNSNAEKWHEKLVVDVLNEMIDVLEDSYEVETSISEEEKETSGNVSIDEDGSIQEGGSSYRKVKTTKARRTTHLKEELLIMFKIRNPKWFAYMAKKFKENQAVFNLLEYIDMNCKVNTYNDAANGSVNASIAKMNLATHYGWSDSVKSEVNHGGKVQVDTPDVPKDIMDAFTKAANFIKPDDE